MNHLSSPWVPLLLESTPKQSQFANGDKVLGVPWEGFWENQAKSKQLYLAVKMSLFSADPCKLSYPKGLLLRQTLLRRWAPGRVQTVSSSSEQGQSKTSFLKEGRGMGSHGLGHSLDWVGTGDLLASLSSPSSIAAPSWGWAVACSVASPTTVHLPFPSQAMGLLGRIPSGWFFVSLNEQAVYNFGHFACTFLFQLCLCPHSPVSTGYHQK